MSSGPFYKTNCSFSFKIIIKKENFQRRKQQIDLMIYKQLQLAFLSMMNHDVSFIRRDLGSCFKYVYAYINPEHSIISLLIITSIFFIHGRQRNILTD